MPDLYVNSISYEDDRWRKLPACDGKVLVTHAGLNNSCSWNLSIVKTGRKLTMVVATTVSTAGPTWDIER